MLNINFPCTVIMLCGYYAPVSIGIESKCFMSLPKCRNWQICHVTCCLATRTVNPSKTVVFMWCLAPDVIFVMTKTTHNYNNAIRQHCRLEQSLVQVTCTIFIDRQLATWPTGYLCVISKLYQYFWVCTSYAKCISENRHWPTNRYIECVCYTGASTSHN